MRASIALTLGILLATATSAPAQWLAPCLPPCCLTYEPTPVVCYRPEWRAERVPCVVEQVNYRREVTAARVQILVPRMFDEQVRVSHYVPTPREVEREVWCCVALPIVSVDPCTCCPIVTFTSHWVRHRVRCVEYDYRLVERLENVRVCRMVPEERVIEQVRYVPEISQVQSWTVRWNCVMVPYQTTVWVPCWR